MSKNNYLFDLCDNFSFKNIAERKTSFRTLSGTSLDILLTHSTRNIHSTAIMRAGLSDHHKMTTSLLRSDYEMFPPKKAEYGNYKKLDCKHCLRDLNEELLKDDMDDNLYSNFIEDVNSTLSKHAPLKKRIIGEIKYLLCHNS